MNENPILDAVTIRETVRKNTDDALKKIMEQQIKEEMRRIIKEGDSEYEEEEVDLQADAPEMPEVETEEGVGVGEEEIIDDVPGEEQGLEGMEEYEIDDDTYDVSQDDEAAIKIFKNMTDSDQIVVTKQGSTIEISDEETGSDYIIDLNEEEDMLGESTNVSPSKPEMKGRLGNDAKSKLTVPVQTPDKKGTLGAGTGTRMSGRGAGEGTPFEDTPQDSEFGTSGCPIGKNRNGDNKPFKQDPKIKEFGTSGTNSADSTPFRKRVNENEEEPMEEITEDVDEGLVRTHRSLRNVGKKSDNQIKVPVKQGRVPAVRDGAQLKTENKELIARVNKIIEENIILKETVKQLKECAQNFYVATQETVLTNQKLGKAIQLFSEHSTTLDEKKNIIERFEGHKTSEDIQALYETINKELKSRKPIIESVDTAFNNIITEIKLTDQPSIVNEDVKKMLDLMKRIC
jgi:hypothetical protein